MLENTGGPRRKKRNGPGMENYGLLERFGRTRTCRRSGKETAQPDCRKHMSKLTQTEKDIIERFGWSLVNPGSGSGQGSGRLYLIHPLLHGAATMAIPVDLEHGTLKYSVASAARTFSVSGWIRNADLSKYEDDPLISVETRVRSDAEYAQRELNTLCTALGIR